MNFSIISLIQWLFYKLNVFLFPNKRKLNDGKNNKQKAEYSLKAITERLRQELLKNIDIYYPNKNEKKS